MMKMIVSSVSVGLKLRYLISHLISLLTQESTIINLRSLKMMII